MIVLGLTGSIGMGKSTVAAMFRDEGIPVFEADAAVHTLYKGEAAPLIENAFPGTTRDGEVDRTVLAQAVLDNPQALKKLESIVHPLVHRAERAFVEQARAAGEKLVVLDIPLLYEKQADSRADRVLVVSAPAEIQKERVMRRPGMTEQKFEALLSKQVPDAEKRARADIVINTDVSLDETRQAVRDVVRRFSANPTP